VEEQPDMTFGLSSPQRLPKGCGGGRLVAACVVHHREQDEDLDGAPDPAALLCLVEEPVRAQPSALVAQLSERELDVLRLLRSDLSGPDIARELHVSLNTLRTHTKHIYTKLGATKRREALTCATELGL
jgi:ATP/maltotriose-dependent transcriptional regulator MalT